MTIITNRSFIQAFRLKTSRMVDNLNAPVAATQATATPLTGDLNVVVTSVGTGSVILPSILTGEAEPVTVVVNNSPNAINLYPGLGENINALGANAAFAITSLSAALCVTNGLPPPTGGVATANARNWLVMQVP